MIGEKLERKERNYVLSREKERNSVNNSNSLNTASIYLKTFAIF